VVVRSIAGLADWQAAAKEILDAHAAQREVRAEGLLVRLDDVAQAASLRSLRKALGPSVPTLFVETSVAPADFPFDGSGSRLVVVKAFSPAEGAEIKAWGEAVGKHDAVLAADLDGPTLTTLAKELASIPSGRLILTSSQPQDGLHATGTYRELVRCADIAQLQAPLWIRATVANAVLIDPGFQSRLIEASIHAGGLLVDGYGDFLSCETTTTTAKSLTLAFDILQGARMRQTKTEYVACPSCGRTLFDIQSTTLKIKERTGHLKSVTIAVMGCIVNGPGEMADADFGYVGGAPGKINLYVGKTPVKFNIPQEEAVERLVDLIKEKGRWLEA
jgi:(E)-4-hydroxy-3-methylbut-2-enyl-diphosphate synthase